MKAPEDSLPVDLEEAMSALRQVPDPVPSRMADARQALLTRARSLRAEQAVSAAAVVRHKGWISGAFARRTEGSPMMIMAKAALILLLLAGATTGTALAADASLPGQPLYALDLGLEQARLSLAATPEARAQISLRAAGERADEIIALARAGAPPTPADQERLRTQLNTCLQLATRLRSQEQAQYMTRLAQQIQQQAATMQGLGLTDSAAIMEQARVRAQVGADQGQGQVERERNGAGWPTEAPVPGEEPPIEPTATAPALTEPQREQERTQAQRQGCEPGSITCTPMPTGQQNQNQNQNQNRHQAGTATATPAPTDEPGGTAGGPPPESPGAPGGQGSGGNGGNNGGGKGGSDD